MRPILFLSRRSRSSSGDTTPYSICTLKRSLTKSTRDATSCARSPEGRVPTPVTDRARREVASSYSMPGYSAVHAKLALSKRIPLGSIVSHRPPSIGSNDSKPSASAPLFSSTTDERPIRIRAPRFMEMPTSSSASRKADGSRLVSTQSRSAALRRSNEMTGLYRKRALAVQRCIPRA